MGVSVLLILKKKQSTGNSESIIIPFNIVNYHLKKKNTILPTVFYALSLAGLKSLHVIPVRGGPL